ncbi:MAG: HYR domain-containing protein [Flavobacteriales bacterium]|nr:HYR domain-containing protein [Flavobacteriales bacterium]
MRNLYFIFFALFAGTSAFSQTVTKSTAVGSVTIDGCGTYCSGLDAITFSRSDFGSGCRVTDVNVSITWAKTDGSCTAPGIGFSYHEETSFRLDGPTGNQEVLIPPGYYDGDETMSAITTVFNQGSPQPTIAGGTPQAGTFGPAGGGNLNDFNNTSAFGTWNLRAGDSGADDPLCVDQYSITIVTATDNTLPVLSGMPSNMNLQTTAGTCGRVVTWTTPTATDNCGTTTVTRTAGPASGSIFPLGVTTVTYQATDSYGNNSASQSFTVTITDGQAPTFTSCPTSFTAPSACGTNVTYANPTATDVCAGNISPVLIGGLPSGSDFPSGATTVTWRATDPAGNFTDCSFVVTVSDNTSPVITCPTGTLTAVSGSGNCLANVPYTVSATDNCPSNVVLTGNASINGGNFNVGTHNLSFTASDGANSASCSFVVQVNDNTLPVLTCPANINATTDAGLCAATVNWGGVSVSDNCSGSGSASQSSGPNPGGPNFPVGVSTVSYSASDASGNVGTCSFSVTVADNQPPTISCPTAVVTYSPGACGAQVTWANPVPADNCSLPSNPLSRTDQIPLSSGNTFQNGSYTIGYEVRDASNNTTDCTFSFTVADTEDPEWDPCPSNFTVSTDPDVCTALVNFTIDADDNCTANPTITQVSALGNGDVFPIGATTVEYSVVDGSGNSPVNCVFVVTVEDNEFPDVVCPSSVTTTFPNCQYVLADFTGDPGIADNCVLASVVQVPSAGIITVETTITITATDDAGNESSCAWTVTPFDNTPPTFDNCPTAPQLVAVNNSCQFLMPDFTIGLTASDVCNPSFTFTQTPSAGTLHLNPVSVTVTVSDGANSVPCTFLAQPNDLLPPSIICPADRTIAATSGCEAVLPDYTTLPSVVATDNCGGTPVVTQPSVGATVSGTYTVTLVATDDAVPNPNQSTCTFNVTVLDNTPPTVTCPGTQTAYYNANCAYAITDFTGLVTATDNCPGSVALTQTPSAGTAIGSNSSLVTITGTDVAGNHYSCQFTLNLEDNIPPSLACPQAQQVNVNSNCEYNLADFTSFATSTEACSSVTISQLPASGTVYDFTVNPTVTVTLTATDGATVPNSISCTFQVLLNDVTAPVITCGSNLNVLFDGSCEFVVGTRTSNYVGLLSDMDNCDNAPIITQSPSSQTVIQGQTTVTLTATDASGNAGTCQFNITPIDSQGPTVDVCPQSAITVNYDANCNYTLADLTGNASFSDNCDLSLNITQSPGFGTVISNQSNTTVTITATDDAGNSNYCAITVSPVDVTAPTLVCPTAQLEDFDANCAFTLVDYTAMATATDNCSNSLTVTQFPGSGQVITGSTSILITAVDAANNSTQCTFNVIPDDNTPPTITCPTDQTVALNSTCTYNMIDMTGLATGVQDNCPSSVVVTQSVSVGTSLGANTTIVLTATDGAGNTATCQFDVLPTDQTAPSIVCPQNQVVSTNASCLYDLVSYTGQAVATDFCDPTVTVTQDPVPATGISIGTVTTVTLTATDDATNTSTCTFTVSAVDNTAPTISCPTDTIVSTDVNCQYVMINETNNHELVISDNCDASPTVTQSPAVSTVLIAGITTVTLTVEDASGNTGDCTYTYTIEDQVNPTIICPLDLDVSSNALCQFVVPDYTAAGSTDDNCDPFPDVTQTPAVGSSFSGSAVVTLTVVDADNNFSSCTFTITENDQTDPTITCPGNLQVNFDGNCQYQLIDYTGLAVATDNCGSPTVAQDVIVGDYITSQTTVTLTATDADLNQVSCSFEVIPSDIGVPSVSCLQPVITVPTGGQCSFTLPDYTGGSFVSATDNCTSSFVFTQSPVAGSLIGGSAVVTLSTIDPSGNVGSCTMTVSPEDQTAPVLFCPANTTVALDANCEFDLPDYTPLVFVSDNCDSSPFSITQSPIATTTISGEAITTISFSVTDGGNNVGTCSFTVTTEDNQAPSISCPADVTVSANSNCEFTLADYTGQVSFSDNCSNPNLVQTPATGDYSGNVLVTITATDDAGNTNNCSFNVSPVDDTAPSLTCPPNQTPNFTANCEFTVIDYTSLSTFSDDCDNTPFVTQSPGIGTIISGTTTVSITVTDDAGNTSTCTFDILPEDHQVPVITCPASFAVDLSASCDFAIVDYTSLVTVSDNCDLNPTIIQSPSTGIVSGTSASITMTALDANSNSATCTFNIILEDNSLPVLTNCPTDQTVPLSANCQFIVANYTGVPTVSDNCGPSGTVTQTPLAGSLIGGATVVTISATDLTGNVGICSFTVSPEDVNPPTIFGCPTDIVQVNDLGICGALVTYATITALDNCAGVVVPQLTQGQASGTIFPVGLTNVVYVADDGNGNTTNCEFDVTVSDTEDPIIVCPVNVTVNSEIGTCGATVTYSTPVVTDNCTTPIVPTLEAGLASGSTFSVGATTVTYEADDSNGNASTCSFIVTVEDDEDPVITCPPSVTVNNDPGNCDAVVTYALPTVTDNCTGSITPVLTLGLASGSTFPLGTTPIRYSATDGSGNTSLCSFSVTVEDTEDPLMVCPNGIVAYVEPNTCQAVVTYDDPTVTDNCNQSIVPMLQSGLSSGDSFPLGDSQITFSATDGNGQSVSCSFTITVEDNEAPVVTCPSNQTELFNNICQLTIPDYTGLATTSDNCDANPVVSQLPAPSSVITGVTTVTLSSTDVDGNTASCSFVVSDETPPVVTCPLDQVVGSNINCQFTLPDYMLLTVSSDNCGPVSLAQSPAVGTVITGFTTVTISSEDNLGNQSTCQFTVDLIDNIAPSITCIGNQQAFFDANCMFQLPDYSGQASSIDNCDLTPTITQSPTSGSMIGGTSVITLTAEDDNGNSTSCTFSVAPYDNLAPSITCPSAQVAQLDGNCEFGLSDFTGLAVTDDNCSSLIIVSQSPAVGSTQSSNTIVTLTASDDNNNTSSCAFVVQPEDNVDPVIVCPSDLAVDLDQNCIYSLADFTVAGVASDNCSTVILVSQSPLAGTSVTSLTAVTLTANDGNGNSSTCSFNVTPEDNTPPTVVCAPDQNVSLNSDCQFEISDYIGFVTATDNCSNTFVITQSPSAGTLISSTSSVTLTAQDGNGNTASCSFSVIPADETDPTITCPQDQDVSFNANCAFILPDYTGMAVVDDNCGLNLVVTQDILAGTSIAGTVTVTLTVDDGNGNSDACSFVVNPSDNSDPTVTCPSTVFVSLNENCEFLLEDYKPEVVASDNCNATSITQSPIEGTAISSTTQILITVSDLNGNSVSCTFNVVPSDDVTPTIVCPNAQFVSLDANCQFVVEDYSTLVTASDNCASGMAVSQFPPQGTFILTGTAVTMTVEDDNGNEATCTFGVIPEDNTDPVIVQCPSDQLATLNSSCSFTVPNYTSLMSAEDNCDITLSYQQIPAAGSTIFGTGTYGIQITVEDDNGNSDNCAFNLTVDDVLPPTVICPSDQVLQLSANCNFALLDYTTLATASDACGTVTLTQSPAVGTVITGQLNTTIIAEDEDGNTASCTFFVDVVEMEVEVVGTDVTCNSGNDGTATVTVTGGTGPYTENWGGFNPNALPAGNFSVTVSDVNGCSVVGNVSIGQDAPFEIQIQPSGPVQICQGESVVLTAGSGYSQYNWSTGASVASITVTNEASYWLSVINQDGCVSNTDTVLVSFFDQVTPNIISTVDGLLSCSNDTASSYQWSLNGAPIANATNVTYCPTASGNYTVTIVDSYGCTVTSFIEEFTFDQNSPCATGIEEFGLSMDIYPNPSTGVFTISYSLDRQSDMQLAVFDLMGKQVLGSINLTSFAGTTMIDLHNEAEGVYILRIALDNDKVLQQRLVVVK